MKLVEYMCLKEHGYKLLLKLLATPDFLNFIFFNIESQVVAEFLLKVLDPVDQFFYLDGLMQVEIWNNFYKLGFFEIILSSVLQDKDICFEESNLT